MSASTSRRAGFSLLELLVVVGTIALLIAILLPVAAHVRAASRSTKCLANLQQWGQSFQMYLSVNRGHAPPILDGNDHRHFEWWETLAPFHSNVAKTLLCPEADGPRQPPPKDYLRGSAHTAWVVGRHRDGALGSYGFNVWLYATPTGFKAQYFQFPVSRPGPDSATWRLL